ncbi:TRAP transporter small permease subunit [Ferruginivarius sediminum]|uniref:TRAP transporter small permease protein n=1 Tax=Ferruginivarius sediminum TaxID=2661937 RepID=A0A369T843_9PROT|nr:TRAP transporter small permease subunit [Ferruginivarius sediminum]RDD61499.1 C4-dicarboxylate ABC transporter permease [Ferruginivarius sediminum]
MPALLRLSDRLAAVVTLAGKAAGWLAVAMMVVIVFDVVGRRFFHTGSTMLQDLEWHLHGAMFLLAFGFAYLRDAHVRIELLRERWRARPRAWIEIAGIVLFLLPYCGIVIWFGYDFAERAFVRNEGSMGGMGLPHRWIIKSMLPVGFAVMALAGISVLLRLVAVLADRDADGRGRAYLMQEPGVHDDEATT